MRKTLLTVLVAAAMTSTLAQAATGGITPVIGQLNFTGNITDAAARTCNITIDGAVDVSGVNSVNVDLGTIDLDEVNKDGYTPASKTFEVAFSACPAMTTAQLTLGGTKDDNFDAFKNTAAGGATGVAVEVKETIGGTVMVPGTINSRNFPVSGDKFSIPLAASIIKTSPAGTNATAGAVTLTSTIQITYD